jgi:bis(5'-nucleosyl)-tetraphosphatase (symmetrical)
MQTYAIGDVQGCFDGLLKLLDKISFNEQKDKLIFLGDVVNRGDKSLQTLEFIKEIDARVVLGNHDYYLLACYFGIKKPHKKDTFTDILQAKNVKKLIDFLLSRDVVINEDNNEKNNFFVHAGIPPIFNKEQTLKFAKNIKQSLSENPEQTLKNTFGNQNYFDENLSPNDKLQYSINAFMRMRFCQQNGNLDFEHKQNIPPANFKPWFEFEGNLPKNSNIYFGHWSSLVNQQINDNKINIYPMDTGYIWGGDLSCIRLNDNAVFSVK